MAESYKFSHWGSTSEDILATHFPLHRACRDGDIEALSSLLIQAQHGVYAEDNFYGWTPAHWAAYFGKLACLRKLMQVTRVGAECDVKSSRFCQTPAHLAAFGGHPQSLLWLLQSGAGHDCQDYLGETPVHKAARSGSMECISLLISHGAKLFIKNISGLTAADLASNCGHLECSKYMENAAASQQDDPRGVYHQQEVLERQVAPSPADVTAAQASGLVNGAGHQTNGVGSHASMAAEVSQDCEMDDGTMDVSSHPETALAQLFAQPSDASAATQDVTINPAISNNNLPVAGQKRSREETEEPNFKRLRTSVSDSCYSPANGINGTVFLSQLTSVTTKKQSSLVQIDGYQAAGLHGTELQLTDKHLTQQCNNSDFSQFQSEISTEQQVGSDSAQEHMTTVLASQGYDSLCYESMFSHP